jgi:hypothetical protein
MSRNISESLLKLFIQVKKKSEWIKNMTELLLESDLDTIIEKPNVCENSTKNDNIREPLPNYLENNRFRMDYKLYRSKNWLMGSNPIESIQRTIVQQMLKLSRQRRNIKTAQNILNHRTCQMSNQLETIINKCRLAA